MTQFSDLVNGEVIEKEYIQTMPFITIAPLGGYGDYVCDGVDDYLTFEEVIERVGLAGGGTIFVRKGTYSLLTTRVNYNNLHIIGEKGTILKCGGIYQSILQVGVSSSATKTCENIIIENFIFDGDSPNIVHGAGVNVSSCDNVKIINNTFQNFLEERGLRVQVWDNNEYIKKDVEIRGNHFNNASIVLGGINGGSMSHNTFRGAQDGNDCVADVSYSEHPGASLVHNFTISDNTFVDIVPASGGSIVVLMGFNQVHNVTVENNIFSNIKGSCLKIRCDLMQDSFNLNIQGNVADTISSFVDGGPSALMTRIEIANNVLSNSENFMISAPSQSCIHDNYIENTDTDASGPAFISGAILVYHTDNVNIYNNIVKDTQAVATTSYGVYIETADNINVWDNDLEGPFTWGAIKTGGVNTNITIRRNFGYITENSGTGTIANGATSATITHGLSATPTLKDITITLGENPTNTPGAIWVDTIGATTFQVNCENDPGASNLDFAWKAEIL